MESNFVLALAIFGATVTWTTSVVAMTTWLNTKFRRLEVTFFKEMDKHQESDNEQFEELRTRAMRLELNAFGFTHSGSRREVE